MKFQLLGVGAMAAVVILAGSSVRADDFTPPVDGKLSEPQVTNYIAILKEQIDSGKAAGAATAGMQSSAASMAVGMRAASEFSAAITRHGMTEAEYSWAAGAISRLWPTAVVDYQWKTSGKADLQKQIAAKQADAAADRDKLAAYQSASTAGVRVFTKEQRDAAIAAATSERDAAASDLKDRQGELKAIQDELAAHEKDAADAQALADHPPADVSADDRQGYIDGKKSAAQTALDSAKDSRTRLSDAQKAFDDTNTRLSAANLRVAHPETPTSDDDKAQVKQENDQAVADAKSAVENDDLAVKTLQETLAAGPPNMAQQDKQPGDDTNLPLVEKHLPDLLTAMGASDILKSK